MGVWSGVDFTNVSDRPILLFDGECGLCQASARFVLSHDVEASIGVATLQGELGQMLLRRLGLPTDDFDSMVFVPNCAASDCLLRTDGVVAILKRLPGWWRGAGTILGWFPTSWRDGGYRLVARVRPTGVFISSSASQAIRAL